MRYNIIIRDVQFWGKNSVSEGGMSIEWACDKLGCGVMDLYRENGMVRIDDNYMGKDFMKQVLNAVIDKEAIL